MLLGGFRILFDVFDGILKTLKVFGMFTGSVQDISGWSSEVSEGFGFRAELPAGACACCPVPLLLPGSTHEEERTVGLLRTVRSMCPND